VADDRTTKYVFMHVPKTAGMSLRARLGEFFSPEAVSPIHGVRPIGPDEVRELAAYRVIAEHISGRDVTLHFPDRAVFTFLRDPVDRCLSLYGYFRQLTNFPLIPLDRVRGVNNAEEATSLARQLDPDDFFRCDHPHVWQNLENRAVWQIGYRAAVEYRRDITPAEAFEQARRELERYLFVGFYESLEADVARLCRALRAPAGSRAMPWENRTASPLRRGDISPATRRAIERANEWDRRLYDFAQNLVGRRSAA
jgi:hypothetical protein